MPPDNPTLRALLARQDAVVSRAQVLAAGGTGPWVARRAATGRWQRVHPGVYVAHSGPIPWRSRAWAALLHAGPGAAVSHAAAAYVHGFVAVPPRVVDVSIPAARRVDPQPGLRVHRRRTMPPVLGRLPVVARGDTVLDVVQGLRAVDDVVGLVCVAVRAGMWPQEVLEPLGARRRVRHRALLADVLAEVGLGIESPLERRYHHDVERAHGLPRSRLQVRQHVGGRWTRADGIYEGLGVRTELDGELAHPGGRTDGDVWRDNAVVINRGELTLRYRWHHVAVAPCATARQVEQALRSRGWSGRGRPCGPSCPVGR